MGAGNLRENLSVDEARRLLQYDPDTGIIRWIVDKPGGRKAGDEAGCITRKEHPRRYIIVGVNRELYMAHRLAFLLHEGRWPCGDVDHKDGDGLNNRWTNLREVSRTLNMQNACKRSDNTSGFVGVYWHGQINKWYAQITVRGKTISLGCFEKMEDAVAARKEAERKYGYSPNHGRPAA